MEQFFQFWLFVMVAAYGIRAMLVEVRRWLTGKDLGEM